MGAERGTGRLAVLGEGEAVEVRGDAVGEWQPVNCAGVGGYINTSLIAWEPAAPVAAGYRNDHAPSAQVRSWDDPYQDGSGRQQPASFEVEAVTPEPISDAPAAAEEDDAWSEIPLVEHADQVDASAIGGNYSLDEDEGEIVRRFDGARIQGKRLLVGLAGALKISL
jgi:hypothetical protein